MKDLKIDLSDCLEIITHPMHLPLIYTSLDKLQTCYADEGIFFPRIPPISSSQYLEPYRKTGNWNRTNILPDTPYVTWVEDITNPSSWAIYFGLVETEEEPNIYIIKKPVQPLAFTERQKDFNKAEDDFNIGIHRARLNAIPITPWQNPSVFTGVV